MASGHKLWQFALLLPLAMIGGYTGMLKLGEGGIQAGVRSLIFAWWQGLWKNLEEQR